MIHDADIADIGLRIAAAFKREEPCRSWAVFIEWYDENGQPWTYHYGARNSDTYEEAIREVVGYITDMPTSWRIRRAWAARATDITEMDGYRFNRTPSFQVR